METYDIVIIGGGPAGLAAAVSARQNGMDRIVILDRNPELGGILNQCIHNGFGLHTFQEELTGPEYAGRFIKLVKEAGIEYRLNTMVTDVTPEKVVEATNREDGLFQIQAKAVILAMGCRERARGALNIPGYRPAGIYSAGTAQRFINMEGCMPGREVVILGSGDIGLIMARRMTLEGARVKLVAELMPYSGGLNRNIVQCLDDYGIPLKLRHTIIEIKGKERVEGIVLAEVDNNGKPIPGTEESCSCDTILHVHDLVDFVSEEAAIAGKNAAIFVKEENAEKTAGQIIRLNPSEGIKYIVPETIDITRMGEKLTLRFRVDNVYKDSYISVYFDEERILHRKTRIAVPGQMEKISLSNAQISPYPDLKTITVKVERE